MSLLWIQGAWHDAQPGTEEWAEYGFGHETREQRRERYIQHVQDAHGVDRETALHALQHVTEHLRGHAPQVHATEYGFASAPAARRFTDLPEPFLAAHAWYHAPVHAVSTEYPIHASQWFITPRVVAHNLFHPGKQQGWNEEEVGHPDVDPEADNYVDHFDTDGPEDLPRLIRQTDGTHIVADGHHRIATDMLLRKPVIQARVLDVRNLSKQGRFRVAAGVGPYRVATR